MITENNLEYILNFDYNKLIINNKLIGKNNAKESNKSKESNKLKESNKSKESNKVKETFKKNRRSKLEIVKNIILSFFCTSLQKFIDNFYETFDFSRDTLVISLFYLNKFYKNNYSNKYTINHFYKNINLYFLTSIILSLKYTLDDYIDTKYICIYMNINHHNYIETEIVLLKSLDWNCNIINNDEFELFKKNTQPYMD